MATTTSTKITHTGVNSCEGQVILLQYSGVTNMETVVSRPAVLYICKEEVVQATILEHGGRIWFRVEFIVENFLIKKG